MGGSHQTSVKDDKAKTLAEYASIFDYMLEGCQIISPDYRYVYVNDVVARQGRRTREELMGRTMMECYPGIEDTEMFGHLKACIHKKEVHYLENEFHFPDGTVGWFELRMEPLPVGAVILSIDITDRKKAEQRLRLLEELRSTFVHMLSRQLDTPLTTMRTSLESLRGAISEALGVEERVQLLAAHNAALEVVGHVGEIAEVLEPDIKTTMRKKPVPMGDLWSPILAECRQRTDNDRLQLVYTEPSAPLPTLRCDPEKIKVVLAGLVDNALRYTVSGKIVIVIDHMQGRVRFQIADTGIGLPIDEHPRVFTQQFRGSNAARLNPHGSGLSLAVAKHYVEQHGGSVGFTSEENKGSTFWFELPLD